MKTPTTEKKGIEAIIYLQSLAGIEETPEDAKSGWRSMSEGEKKRTMVIYDVFKKREKDV